MPTTPRDPYRALLRALLHAAGLGAGAALATAACGGKVVVDAESAADSSGTGGAGGASTSASTSQSAVTVGVSSTGAGGSWPCVIPVPSGDTLTYHCSDALGPVCPPSSAPEVYSAMSKELDSPPPMQFCCEPGCAGIAVAQIACGPDPSAAGCCYQVILMPQDWCMGRPFTIGAEARSALPRARSDWRASSAPDLCRLDRPTREALARAWRDDALLEHASIASFARFVLQLLELGAPAELVTEATQAIGDEVRHAELCFGLASAYAGEAIGPSPLSVEGALAGRKDAAAIVAAAVREGCVGETLAALGARAAADEAEDPAVRAALTTIAEDEERHAAIAFRFVAWALGQRGDGVREGAIRALAEVAAGAKAEPDRDDEPRGEIGSEQRRSDLRRHGRLSAREARRVVERGLSEVVRPCAQALLASADSI